MNGIIFGFIIEEEPLKISRMVGGEKTEHETECILGDVEMNRQHFEYLLQFWRLN